MKAFSLTIFCLIIFLLQLSILGIFFAPGNIPNLVLAFAASLVILKGFDFSLKWIILAGLLVDAGTNWLFGTGILLLVLLAFGIGSLETVADIRSRRLLFWPSFAVLIVILTYVFDLLAGLALKLENHQLGKKWATYGVADFSWDYATKILFTVLAGYLVYYILKKMDRASAKSIHAIQGRGY